MSYLLRSLALPPKNIITRCYNKIVITDDGSTIVALHREQEFPYEFSKPLPEETTSDNGVLRMNDINEVKRVFKDIKPEIARQQLASLTLTTTHRWFPRARDKKAKEGEMNRPYL
ncbi:39S ribosomal protein L42, mitochondrial [Melitaea cinxia]|uniref:39S ribosomal protein L42, mitochondrial n=1 Tax=Melitaea cinxia TaxID=113334 RepID=UPI001E27032C|nr:39S ribosomal protein L42, mitochondrial [Melitaea cinxia]